MHEGNMGHAYSKLSAWGWYTRIYQSPQRCMTGSVLCYSKCVLLFQ
jgi:hypothetical protein